MRIFLKALRHFGPVCKSIMAFYTACIYVRYFDLHYHIGKDISYIFIRGLHNPKLPPVSKPEGK